MEEDVRAAWEAFEELQHEKVCEATSCCTLRGLQPTVVQLADGDWHVCKRERCEFACIDSEHNYYCSLSGLTWGTEFVGENDPSWTGRSTTTGDPDALSGTPVGGWRPRRDAFAESQRAFQAASGLSDREVVYRETQKEKDAREARANVRRGALCVDQEPEEATAPKKPRASKRPQTRELYEKLSVEVSTVMDKLTSVKRVAQPSAVETTSDVDARLQNPEFVLKVALRQLLKRVAAGEDQLDYPKLHDVAVYSHAFAKRKREEANEKADPSKTTKKRCFGGEVKPRVVALVLSLWKAACATDYLSSDARRGADSFRPFVAGILYALKRGMAMSNGLEIIPTIPVLADQLPTLRSSDATDAARQLQSSSHRGLCTLHRSISSFETCDQADANYENMRRAFEDCAAVAAQLKRFVG